jgi:hypothetical protein
LYCSTIDFICRAFLNKGLKALIHFLSSSRSLFGFVSYVKFIATTTRNLLKNRLHGTPGRSGTPGMPGRKRVNRMHSGTAFQRLLDGFFCDLRGHDCCGRAREVWSLHCPE